MSNADLIARARNELSYIIEPNAFGLLIRDLADALERAEEDDEDMSGPRQDFQHQCARLADEEDAHAAPQVTAQATSAPQSRVQHPGPAVAAPLPQKTALTREDVNIYMRNGGSPSIGALALRGLDGPTEAHERLASEKAANEQYAKQTRVLLDERERLIERAEVAEALLCEAMPYIIDPRPLPDDKSLSRRIRAHFENKP